MSEVRIHRSDPGRFVKVPNDTAQGSLARSPAALGYLVYALSQRPSWETETAEKAAVRTGQPIVAVRAIFRQLEDAGYRHRVNRRTPAGRLVSEAHYYDEPVTPCPDGRTCATCKTREGKPAGHTEYGPSRSRSDLARRNASGRFTS